jgi:ESS family glutamate:Na+ symporter
VLEPSRDEPMGRKSSEGFFVQLHRLFTTCSPGVLLFHVALLLVCIKAGAWVSYELQRTGAKFPGYIGAMMVAVVVRNAIDVIWDDAIRTHVVSAIASIALGLFLAMAMAGLNLLALRELAGPMLLILAAQVVLMLLFAWFVTFNLIGRDYDAAVASAGHVGFGVGITPNAVATMDVLIGKFGPSPRALLIVTIVGGFLIDFTNALVITAWLNMTR